MYMNLIWTEWELCNKESICIWVAGSIKMGMNAL